MLIQWLVLGGLALIPLGGFALAFRLSGRRLGVAILAATIVGAAIGGFIASAASAMATAVDPTQALLRGLALGGLGGTIVGGLAAAIVVFGRSRTG